MSDRPLKVVLGKDNKWKIINVDGSVTDTGVEGKAQFMNVDGEILGVNQAGINQLRTPEQAGEAEATKQEVIEERADISAFKKQYNETLPKLADEQADLEMLMDIIDDPDTPFGPLAGRLGRIYDPNTAKLKMMEVNQIINTLGSVQTGALSEGELELFRQRAVNSDQSRESNRAIVEELLRMVRRQARGLRARKAFLDARGNFDGYGDTAAEMFGPPPGAPAVAPATTPTVAPVPTFDYMRPPMTTNPGAPAGGALDEDDNGLIEFFGR